MDLDNPKIEEICIISINKVHGQIWEPRIMLSSGWYSICFNKATIVYGLGITTDRNKLVLWINGPFPAGQNNTKYLTTLKC
jgi:hypothetical protein